MLYGKRFYMGMGLGLMLFGLSGCHLRKEPALPVWTEDAATESEDRETPSPEDGRIWVHVCGAVAEAGVYMLPVGSRLQEAIEAAGGMTADASLDYLNLARVLSDGEQIYVPRAEEVAAGQVKMPGDTAGSEKVNLNTATGEELEQLPGIGEVKAKAILAYRASSGGFETIEELMNVSGIGEAVFQQLKEYITV